MQNLAKASLDTGGGKKSNYDGSTGPPTHRPLMQMSYRVLAKHPVKSPSPATPGARGDSTSQKKDPRT